MNKSELRRIVILMVGLIALFLGAIVYLTYFYLFEAETVRNHPSNRRPATIIESILILLFIPI